MPATGTSTTEAPPGRDTRDDAEAGFGLKWCGDDGDDDDDGDDGDGDDDGDDGDDDGDDGEDYGGDDGEDGGGCDFDIWTKTAQQHARLCTGVRRMIGAASTEKLTVSVACRHSPRAIHVAKPGSFISNVVGVATA